MEIAPKSRLSCRAAASSFDSPEQRRPITASGDADDPRAMTTADFRRSIGPAVVRDQHFSGHISPGEEPLSLDDARADGFGLIRQGMRMVSSRSGGRTVRASLSSARELIFSSRAARTPAGHWVLGFKYDDTKTEDGRPLTRQDLDVAAPGHTRATL